MPITVTAGAPVGATGGSWPANTPLEVFRPGISSSEVFCLAVSVTAGTPTLAAVPEGMSLRASQEHGGTTNTKTYLYWAVGSLPSAVLELVISGGQTGRLSAIPFVLGGADVTAVFENSAVIDTLVSPALTSVAATEAIVIFANREPSANPTAGYTWGAAPAGLTEAAKITSTLDNGTTQNGLAIYYRTLAPAASSGSYTATTNNTGATASITLLVKPGTGAPPNTGTGSGFTGYLQKLGGLTHYYPLNDTYALRDVIAGRDLTNHNGVTFASAGASFGGGTALANGKYLEVADSADFSLAGQASKGFTVIAFVTVTDWTASNRDPNGTGYCHLLGKGSSTTDTEWMLRHYFSPDTSGQSRAYRMSGYYFNPSDEYGNGHLGAGSYVQPESAATPGTERMIAMTYDTATTSLADGSASSAFPGASHLNFNGGAHLDTDGFDGSGTYKIHPQRTEAPVRIGTTHDGSFFKGVIRRLAFFNRKLSDPEINDIYFQRTLAEGAPGGSLQDTVPEAPLHVTALRGSADTSIVHLTWDPPGFDGGDTISAYQVVWTDGITTVTSADLAPSARSYDASGVANTRVTFSVRAKNAVGYGQPGQAVVAMGVSLPLLGTLSDNFNASADPQRIFDQGVVQANGQLEVNEIDATRRGSYLRGDFRGQSMFYQLFPSGATNDVTSMFVRSTLAPAQVIRVAVQNGVIIATYDQGAPDPARAFRPYSAVADAFWRIRSSGGLIQIETSSNGTTWNALGRTGFADPGWLNDVQAGVEIYNSASV